MNIQTLICYCLCSLILAGCKDSKRSRGSRVSEAEAIETVLARHTEILAKQDQFDSFSKTNEGLDKAGENIRKFARSANAIDLSDCPSDFAEAFVRYISACSHVSRVMANHPHIRSTEEAVLEGFLRGLAGDPTGGSIEMHKEFRKWGNQLQAAVLQTTTTWDEVRAVSVRHGVHK